MSVSSKMKFCVGGQARDTRAGNGDRRSITLRA